MSFTNTNLTWSDLAKRNSILLGYRLPITPAVGALTLQGLPEWGK
jgi:hypothetical protein